MKKVVSLLVAIATCFTMGVAAYAADDFAGTRYSSEDRATGTVRYSRNAESRVNVIGVSGDIQVGARELFLVDESNKVIGGVYNKLDPDTEYVFNIYYNDTDSALVGTDATVISSGKHLTGALLKNGTVRLRTVKGSTNIQSAKIKTIGRGEMATYQLVINTRANFGTKLNEVQYSLTVNGSTAPADAFAESDHLFEVGYETIDDNETDVGEEGTIIISNDAPVITKDQFVDIAKSANYKTVRFEGEDGGWVFAGRVSGMKDSNFYYTYDVIPEIINRFPDQEYKFLSFRAGVTFPTNGEMRIDVSDIYEDFNRLYVYLYRNGKLSRVNATYDSGANEAVFRTNYLGSFVITDTAITDTSIIVDEEDDNINEPEEGGSVNPGEIDNPSTGADRSLDIALTLGVLSLATAGAVSRKKKK